MWRSLSIFQSCARKRPAFVTAHVTCVSNSNAIRAVNSTYGPAWRTPLQILDPRLLQIGGQLDF